MAAPPTAQQVREAREMWRQAMEQAKAEDRNGSTKRKDERAHALCKDDPRNNGTAGRVFGRGPLPADVLPIGTQFNCRYEAKALGVCLNHMTGIEVVEEDGVKVALSLFASGEYLNSLLVLEQEGDLGPARCYYSGQGGFNTRSRRDVGSQQLESASNEALNQCYQRGLPLRLFFYSPSPNPDLEKQEVLVYAGEYKVAEQPYTHRITAVRRGSPASPSAAAASDAAAAEGGAADDPAAAAPATESLVRCRFVLERLPGQARIPRTQGDRCLKVAMKKNESRLKQEVTERFWSAAEARGASEWDAPQGPDICAVCKHDSYGAPLTVCEGRDGRGCQGDFEVCPLCQPEQEDHPRFLGPDWVCPVCAAGGYEQAVEQRLPDCAVINPMWVHCQVAALETALRVCDEHATAGRLPPEIQDVQQHRSELQARLDKWRQRQQVLQRAGLSLAVRPAAGQAQLAGGAPEQPAGLWPQCVEQAAEGRAVMATGQQQQQQQQRGLQQAPQVHPRRRGRQQQVDMWQCERFKPENVRQQQQQRAERANKRRHLASDPQPSVGAGLATAVELEAAGTPAGHEPEQAQQQQAPQGVPLHEQVLVLSPPPRRQSPGPAQQQQQQQQQQLAVEQQQQLAVEQEQQQQKAVGQPAPAQQQQGAAEQPALQEQQQALPQPVLPQPPALAPGLAGLVAQAAERMVRSALRAFEDVDDGRADSMKKPLALLCVAGKGGQTLKDIVHGWNSLPLERQLQLYDTALMAAGTGNWERLEPNLQLALEV